MNSFGVIDVCSFKLLDMYYLVSIKYFIFKQQKLHRECSDKLERDTNTLLNKQDLI